MRCRRRDTDAERLDALKLSLPSPNGGGIFIFLSLSSDLRMIYLMMLTMTPTVVQSPLDMLCEAIYEELIIAQYDIGLTDNHIDEIMNRCYDITY